MRERFRLLSSQSGASDGMRPFLINFQPGNAEFGSPGSEPIEGSQHELMDHGQLFLLVTSLQSSLAVDAPSAIYASQVKEIDPQVRPARSDIIGLCVECGMDL